MRGREIALLRLATAGELMAVTMSHLCRWERILDSFMNRKVMALSRASAECQQFAIKITIVKSDAPIPEEWLPKLQSCARLDIAQLILWVHLRKPKFGLS